MPKAVLSDRGVLVVSIDLEMPLARIGLPAERDLEAVSARFFHECARLDLPATWALADPVHSAATDRVRRLPGDHEIAIFGDASWAGRDAGRRRFAQELIRRTAGARAGGIPVATLVATDAVLDEQADLLVKHGIQAVRCGEPLRGPAEPRRVRFGLWRMPVSLRVPSASRWPGLVASSWTARRQLRRVAARGGVFHLAVDAAEITRNSRPLLRSLERVLQTAARLRDRGRLEVLTVGQVAGRLANVERSEPTQSILRRAG